MINGLDDLAHKLSELGEAASALDGEIAELSFDPQDPSSIESAIQRMEAAIDERVSSYTHNDWVMGISEELNEKYRMAILERAAEARSERDNEQ